MASEDITPASAGGTSLLSFPTSASVLFILRRKAAHTDVVLKAGDLEVPCHKVVLLAASPYYEALFKPEKKKATLDVVEVCDSQPEILESVVDFLYTG